MNPNVQLASDARRVLRGGPWEFVGALCGSATRNSNVTYFRHKGLGFRVLLPVGGAPHGDAKFNPE